MLIKAILISIWAGIAGIDQFNFQTHLHRPIVTGVVVGIILGDMETGLITGATLELIWMGLVSIGGAQPPNVVIGGIIGTAFAILLDQDPKVAVSVAVPFAVAVQGAITLLFTVYSPIMHKFDQLAVAGNVRKIKWLSLSQLPVLFLFNFIVAFLPIYLGVDSARTALESLPSWILDGLSVAGGMMPAVGFAMLLHIMLKQQYIPFLLIGFVLVTYFELSLIGIAIIAIAIAMYDYFRKSTERKETTTNGI
ncbi:MULTISPECIES: PTS N-acetylgalactosamine transporter subunit IIC [Virgibacillus]|uniref:PTS system, N-acetylgalactosamine-specific IIC component n=1 Tax=Virgibacillus chiguensis TaxID=411959 RepID=A0A1M5QP25_9BACI|nr:MULTISPECIES: PTS N-acetylgalactosamine transporter subunit IIC [Virgibacillus]SHH15862.1 PTS system, N-acetylgalactosamine-specific IIC component [Virgibacillus chiguensis]